MKLGQKAFVIYNGGSYPVKIIAHSKRTKKFKVVDLPWNRDLVPDTKPHWVKIDRVVGSKVQ